MDWLIEAFKDFQGIIDTLTVIGLFITVVFGGIAYLVLH